MIDTERSQLPVLAYQYGAKEPMENLPLVREQMRRAHRYRNALVEIELKRRADAEAVLRRLHPELEPLEKAANDADAECEKLATELKAANAKARSRVQTREQKSRLAELRKARSAAWKAFGAARKVAWSDATMKSDQAAVNDAANAAQKRARAECGCYWGTYLVVEEAMKDARKGVPPRFLGWRGEGTVAVQLQGGMSVAELFSGDDTRLRCFDVGPGRGGGRRCVLWLRIGSEGRDPVWTRVPFFYDRPLPDGARIKWAKLHLRRTGTTEEWFVNFSLNVPEDARPDDRRTDGGAVGVDLGWRWTKDGLRVAYWFGSDGEEGELTLAPPDVGRWLWSRDQQGKADTLFDEWRAALAEWLKEREVPEWLAERTEHLGQWKSAARLASVAIHWRTNRFPGDEAIFPAMEDFRRRHKRLFDSARHAEAKAIRWRENVYRNFAAFLRRRYERCAIEDTDWSQMQRMPLPEEATSQDEAMRHYRRIASPGLLAQTLRTFGPKTVGKWPAKDTTRRCASCGEYTSEANPANLLHTCANCGVTEDQDRNAARNLLAALDDASAPVLAGA